MLHLVTARRDAVAGLLSAFTLVALAREARGAAPSGETAIRRWIDTQHAIAEDLSQGRLRGPAWALEVERLAKDIDVAALMSVVNRSVITAAHPAFGKDPTKRFVRFLDDEGRPRKLGYGAALFDFAPRNVITPHGHRHMVSAHVVVGGRLRVRNFDRLGDQGEAMILRATRDYVANVGQVSTMCSELDNIHWFAPRGGPASTFDVVISGLDAGAPDHVIEAVDPLGAKALDDGSLVAPIIPFAQSSARYTADV